MTANDPNDLDNQDFTDDELLDQDDLGDVYDEESFDDENWEDTQAQPAAKPKKKFSVFNLVVFGIAGVIAVVVLMSMFSGGSTPSNPDLGTPQETASIPPTTQQDPSTASELGSLQNGNVPAPETSPPLSNDTNSQGFMNDPAILDQTAQTAPSLPDQGPSMTAPMEAAPSAPQVEASLELPAPQNLPNIDQIKKADASPSETALLPQAAETSTSVPAQDPELQSKLDQLINRMESLEKKIDAQPTSSSGSNSSDIAELRSAVERLESRVSKLAENPAPRSQTVTSYDDEPSKVIVKKSVLKKKASPVKPATTAKWELRGARPGEAMVGKSGQAELQTVRVGDSITGIGQIQSISQTGGRWIIQGSAGSISQ